MGGALTVLYGIIMFGPVHGTRYSAVAVPENLLPLTTMDFYSLMCVMVLYG